MTELLDREIDHRRDAACRFAQWVFSGFKGKTGGFRRAAAHQPQKHLSGAVSLVSRDALAH